MNTTAAVMVGAALALAACDPRPLPSSPADAGPAATTRGAGAGPGPAGAAQPMTSFCEARWACGTEAEGTVCRDIGPLGGLPPGGRDWTCQETNVDDGAWSCVDRRQWLCHGTAGPDGPPAGGCGWHCAAWREIAGQLIYRCVRQQEESDQPPHAMRYNPCTKCIGDDCETCGGLACNYYACARGSYLGGTVCVLQATPPLPSAFASAPCVPGTKRWCEDLAYSGWGQIACSADGTWPTRMVNGLAMPDCHARSDGRRPNTLCACYHPFVDTECCERSDCVVPAGTDGQVCPPAGGQLCQYCLPYNNDCADPDALCVISPRAEAYCAAPCDAEHPCPHGYRCEAIKRPGSLTSQCVPENYSCYR